MKALTESYSALGIGAGAWQLEYPKAGLGNGEWAVGFAENLADACVANAGQGHAVDAPGHWLNARSAALAMERRGLPVAGRMFRRGRDYARFGMAAIIAMAMIALDILRHGMERNELRPAGSDLMAVHGEWSNRTRILLSQAHQLEGLSGIIVLGRPRGSLVKLAAQWQALTGHGLPPLVRPFSLRAAVMALPKISSTLSKGFVLAPDAPFLPALPGMVGMAYRAILGEVSASWWKRQPVAVSRVFYGHTGLADTTALELEQQSSGAKTFHVVHGLSSGLNFVGRSSVGIFQCGHDAEWHARLGGYGRCDADVAPMPPLVQGTQGLLLVSNLAHPMNPSVPIVGTQEELELLDDTLAGMSAHDASALMMWKPHPAVHGLPAHLKKALFDQAVHRGFQRLPDEASLLSAAEAARYVICSTSTAVVEMLAAGVLPVMWYRRPPAAGSALAHYPVKARNSAALTAILAELEDADSRRILFQRAWVAIRPALPFRIAAATNSER